MASQPWWLAGVAGVSLALSGCSLYHLNYEQPAPPQKDYRLHTVQVDDFGSFWDPRQANDVLTQVDESWQQTNTVVAVFIHGWHHNADPKDQNLQDFNEKLLSGLYDELRQPERAELPKRLTGREDFRLIGIYIGWRGRSLPGLLDYGTMWWRKSAAERVGDGDVSEFIERLQRMYLRANALRRPPRDTAVKPYMSLLTLGHSFGGQVLIRSIARPLEFELTRRAPCMATVMQPPTAPGGTHVHLRVNSLGDINVLVNPATEAYQLARIDDLYRQLVFPPAQTPQLVVFSAQNDVARAAFFPIARVLTRAFRPQFRNDYQARLYGEAMGQRRRASDL